MSRKDAYDFDDEVSPRRRGTKGPMVRRCTPDALSFLLPSGLAEFGETPYGAFSLFSGSDIIGYGSQHVYTQSRQCICPDCDCVTNCVSAQYAYIYTGFSKTGSRRVVDGTDNRGLSSISVAPSIDFDRYHHLAYCDQADPDTPTPL